MNRILSAAETRELDRIAIEEHGIPGILLMEHAARAVAARGREMLGPGGRLLVVAGGGNNGGDGYAAARLLLSEGRVAEVFAVVPPEKLRGDAALQARIFTSIGGRIRRLSELSARPGDVVVDAIFGTGLSRPPEGEFAEAIRAIRRAREAGAKVLAVDLPSGVHADTGQVLDLAVKADHTVTFGAYKRAHFCHPGAVLAGEVEVAPISWPPGILEAVTPAIRLLDDETVRALLPRREEAGHKGSFGHCLVVAGSSGKTGAAALSGLGALIAGAGLCTVASRPEALAQIQAHAMELMGQPLPGAGALSSTDSEALLEAAKGKAAILVGPGIPRGEGTWELLESLMSAYEGPLVLDADALNALVGRVEILRKAAGPVVLTPHPGEMARLLGRTVAEVQADRIEVARGFARAQRCVVVLKGAHTVIADPDGGAALCPVASPALATGGTGDVLAGVLTGLLAQGMEASAAARAAVQVHARAGESLLATTGTAGLLASDLLEAIRGVWARWAF